MSTEQQLVVAEPPLREIKDFSEYVSLAIRTKSPVAKGWVVNGDDSLAKGPVVDLLHANTGTESELGELVGCLKSHVFYGKGEDKINLIEELGDIWWYDAIEYAAALEARGVPLSELSGRDFDHSFSTELVEDWSGIEGLADTLKTVDVNYFHQSPATKAKLRSVVSTMLAAYAASSAEAHEKFAELLEGVEGTTEEEIIDMMTVSLLDSVSTDDYDEDMDDDDLEDGEHLEIIDDGVSDDEKYVPLSYTFRNLLFISYALLGKGADIRKMWAINIQKLEKRYPGAFFDADRAIERTSIAEEQALIASHV